MPMIQETIIFWIYITDLTGVFTCFLAFLWYSAEQKLLQTGIQWYAVYNQ